MIDIVIFGNFWYFFYVDRFGKQVDNKQREHSVFMEILMY